MPSYIAVEGPIGVGKTTLTQLLQEKLSARVCMDVFDNPFLPDFYRDRPQAAFRAQMYFLISRFRQQLELAESLRGKGLLVCDYLFARDKIFAYLNLDDQELLIYDRYFETFSSLVPSPGLVVYLKAPKEVLLERVKRRNVDFEARIAESYLEALIEAYDHFFFGYKDTPLLIVNTAEIDFVESEEDLQGLLQRITGRSVRGTQYYHPVRRK